MTRFITQRGTTDRDTVRHGGYTRRSALWTAVAAMTVPFVSAWGQRRGGDMEIKRSGSQPSMKGPAEWFTGTVRIDPLFDPAPPARAGGVERHVRAWRPYRMAHAPARSDADRDRRFRPGAAVGWSGGGDPAGRRRVDSTWGEALAWRLVDHGDDAHRHPREPRRQGRGLAGARHRGAVRRPISVRGRVPGPRARASVSTSRSEGDQGHGGSRLAATPRH